jgi:hypothetical protein
MPTGLGDTHETKVYQQTGCIMEMKSKRKYTGQEATWAVREQRRNENLSKKRKLTEIILESLGMSAQNEPLRNCGVHLSFEVSWTRTPD